MFEPEHLPSFFTNKKIACIRLGNIHVISVSNPEIAREFLKKQDFASRFITWSSENVTCGYLSATLTPYGEQWIKMKKIIISELISPVRHKWLQDKKVEEANNLVRFAYNECLKRWRNHHFKVGYSMGC